MHKPWQRVFIQRRQHLSSSYAAYYADLSKCLCSGNIEERKSPNKNDGICSRNWWCYFLLAVTSPIDFPRFHFWESKQIKNAIWPKMLYFTDFNFACQNMFFFFFIFTRKIFRILSWPLYYNVMKWSLLEFNWHHAKTTTKDAVVILLWDIAWFFFRFFLPSSVRKMPVLPFRWVRQKLAGCEKRCAAGVTVHYVLLVLHICTPLQMHHFALATGLTPFHPVHFPPNGHTWIRKPERLTADTFALCRLPGLWNFPRGEVYPKSIFYWTFCKYIYMYFSLTSPLRPDRALMNSWVCEPS